MLEHATAELLTNAIVEAMPKNTQRNYHEATVLRTDEDGVVWVSISGGAPETPVSYVANECDVGDTVSVVIENGKARIVSNLSKPSASSETVERNYTTLVEEIKMGDDVVLNRVEANYAKINDLNASNARIGTIEADYLKAADMTAEQARVGTLLADYTKTSVLESDYAKIDWVQVNYLTAGTILATYAKINDLNAATARIGTIEADYLKADMSNTTVAWIQNGVIKDGSISSAMINDVSANKLTAGTINGSVINVTNLNADNITTGTINGQRIGAGSLSLDKLSEDVYTESEVDAKLATMQAEIDGAIETWTGTEVPTLSNAPASNWSDAATRDTHVGDVYFVVNSQSQQNGYNYRFTKSGSTYSWQLIKDNDVTNALQRISTAEGKITQFDSDISTLKTDTGTLTTRTTSLETRADGVDSALLDKVDTTDFNELSDTVDGHTQTLSQHTTAISNKADGSTVTALTTRVSKNEQDISGINTTIGELQTTVASKADGSDLTTVSNRLNTVSDTVDGHTQTISSVQDTLATKADGSTVETLTTRVSDVEQDVSGFKQTVSETYASKTEAKQTDSASGLRELPTEDAAELPMLGLTVHGECSQDGTPTPDAPVEIRSVRGRNLLDQSAYSEGYLVNNSKSLGAISANRKEHTSDYIAVEEGEMVTFYAGTSPHDANGAASSDEYLWMAYQFYDSSRELVGPRQAKTMGANQTSFASGIYTVEVPSGAVYMRVSARLYDNGVMQLERGSVAHMYVPYGSIAAVTTGKNLLEFSNSLNSNRNGYTYAKESADSIIATKNDNGGKFLARFIAHIPSAGSYTLSIGDSSRRNVYVYSDKLWGQAVFSNKFLTSSAPLMLTFSNAGNYVLGFFNADAAGTVVSLTAPQLERGTEATDYEPYRESVSYIDLKGEELCSLPDGAEDVLTVDASGHVAVEKRVGVVDLGTLDWAFGGTKGGTNRFYSTGVSGIKAPADNSTIANLTCIRYKAVSNANTNYNIEGIAVSSGGTLFVYDKIYESDTTVADFKTAMSGVMLYYEMASQADVDLGYIDLPTTFPNGSVHMEAEIQPVIDGSWWTAAGYDAGKAYNDGNGSADLAALTERVTTAESSITQQAGEIALKANASDTYTKAQTDASLTLKANKATLTSEINASADTVKIDATRVNIEGAAIFTGSGRLSQTSLNNAYDANGAADTALTNAKAYTDSVEVGGRNLLRFTGHPTYAGAENAENLKNGWCTWYNTSGYTVERTDESIKFTAVTTTGGCGFVIPLAADGILHGGADEVLTLSFQYKGNIDSSQSLYLMVKTGANVSRTMKALTASETEWQTFAETFYFPSIGTRESYAILFPYANVAGAWFEVKDGTMKLERGNKPTDWTPAPDDIEANAVSRTQRIWYRQTADGAKPSANLTWLSASGTGYGNWSLTVPQLTNGTTKYPKLYTAVQSQTVAQQAAGTACSCSPVQLDDSTTVIDGGTIITGSVSANKVDFAEASGTQLKLYDPDAPTSYAAVGSSGMDVRKDGESVASFGETARIGKADSAHVSVDFDSVDITNGDGETVAYAAEDKFYADKFEATSSLYVGRYTLRVGADGKLVIGKRY